MDTEEFDTRSVTRMRGGFAAFGLAGVGWFVGYLSAGPFMGAMDNPAEFGTVFAAAGFQAGMLSNMIAMVLSFFGSFALYGYLTAIGSHRSALAGLVATVTGNGLLLVAVGFPVAMLPELGRKYAAGETAAMDVAMSVFTSPVHMTIFVLTSMLITLGIVTFTIGVWRDTSLPRVPVLALLVGFLFLTNAWVTGDETIIFALDLLGASLVAIAGVWLAYRLETISISPSRSAPA